ncbi:MAG: IS110 family transposase [Spirosomataceae bacterium]|jgi:transposase
MRFDEKKHYKMFVGIDVSKNTLDLGLLDEFGKKKGHKCFKNNSFGFESFLDWIMTFYSDGDILFCMEYTGIYSRKVQFFLQDAGFDVCMESGYVIRRASGIVKGKSDKIDAYRIANYALSKRYNLKISDHYNKNITLLHDLLTTRNRLTESLKRLQTPINELKAFAENENFQLIYDGCKNAIDGIKQSILEIDEKIDDLIDREESWKQNIRIVTTINGIGKIVALWMLVYTVNFKPSLNARKFASLAGIAPFTEESGISIRKGAHVSHHSNKLLKGLLHVCAMTAIRNNPTIKMYHLKKKNEGKKGFVVMNNIKNKLVQTAFALVRSGQVYKSDFVHAKAA